MELCPILLPYQKSHYLNILTSIKKYSRALDASDTGTGKTFISIKLCKELKLIPWVICQKSIVSSWHQVLKSFGYNTNEYNVITYEQLALYKALISNNSDNYDWTFESNDNFKGKLKSKYLFIYDEAHRCKNINTINSKIMLALAKYPVKILLLSATIIDKPLYFIPFGIVFGLYKTYQEGLDWMNITIDRKASNPLISIHNLLFNEYASRMRIDDTIGIFKNNKILFDGIEMKNYYEIEDKYEKINVVLELNKKKMKKKNREKKIILQNKKKKKEQLNNEPDNEYNVDNIIKDGFANSDDSNDSNDSDNSDTDDNGKSTTKRNSVQTLRQEIELLKVDTISELALRYLTQNKSVAIFVNFTKTLEELSSKLNTQCVICGSQTLKERTTSIDDFCSDKSRIIICNIQSGSAGISLHDTHGKYPRVSIISPTWSAQNLIQVLGRIHRAMGKTDCLQQLIFCKGTIEESVGNIIRQKITNIRSFNDGNKITKKDNMEVILKSELSKKVKKQDESTYIYKTYDFDAIQERIDNLEYRIEKRNKELNKFVINSHEFKECEFKIRKLEQELNFNLANLKTTIDSMC